MRTPVLGELYMTYCVGIMVDQGLAMIADTRTNAGVDNVSTFRKLYTVHVPGERFISLATAGNLGITQSVISYVLEGFENPESGETETLATQKSMFDAAQFVGRVVREVYRSEGLDPRNPNGFDISMLLAGQIAGRRLRLFMIYSAGNFIEATEETPYLQIGEHKYGKPILDRSISSKTSLNDALKLGLISMDSTIRSNLGVGLPIDLVLYQRDQLDSAYEYRIEQGEPYFHDLRERWSAALRAAHQAIPPAPYAPRHSSS